MQILKTKICHKHSAYKYSVLLFFYVNTYIVCNIFSSKIGFILECFYLVIKRQQATYELATKTLNGI